MSRYPSGAVELVSGICVWSSAERGRLTAISQDGQG